MKRRRQQAGVFLLPPSAAMRSNTQQQLQSIRLLAICSATFLYPFSQRSKHRSAYNNSLAKRESDSVTPPIPSFSFRRRVYFFNLKKYYFFKLKKFSRSMIYKEVEFTAPQVIFYLLCSPRNTSRKRYILIATVHTGGLNKRLCTVYTKNNQYLYLFLW